MSMNKVIRYALNHCEFFLVGSSCQVFATPEQLITFDYKGPIVDYIIKCIKTQLDLATMSCNFGLDIVQTSKETITFLSHIGRMDIIVLTDYHAGQFQ